jgi:hypothetical protein
MKTILIIFAAIWMIIFGPFCAIWALNTLFLTVNIGYTFETWCASALLCLLVKSS